jgi:hypothetical protein
MPTFCFTREDARALIAYLRSIQGRCVGYTLYVGSFERTARLMTGSLGPRYHSSRNRAATRHQLFAGGNGRG